MPPAVNPCELTWIEKSRKVIKSGKPWIFKNPGFSVFQTQKFQKILLDVQIV
jgi:hypothetical protein